MHYSLRLFEDPPPCPIVDIDSSSHHQPSPVVSLFHRSAENRTPFAARAAEGPISKILWYNPPMLPSVAELPDVVEALAPLVETPVPTVEPELPDLWSPFNPVASQQHMAGLLRRARNRAGEQGETICRALLGGAPWRAAAIAGGVLTGGFGHGQRGIWKWMAGDREMQDILTAAEEIGFARTVEAELYRRSFAGKDDRSSMRALEIVAKARRSDYREKSQLEVTVRDQATLAMESAGSWLPSSESERVAPTVVEAIAAPSARDAGSS